MDNPEPVLTVCLPAEFSGITDTLLGFNTSRKLVLVPPFSFIDVPAGDLVSIISNLKKGEKTDISKLESWRFLPFVGRTLYYTVGKGKEKEEKKAKQKEKEK